MFNIAIAKNKETKFFEDGTGKPRSYPTLADALVSAQYLGLTKQDAELYFVKEGASIDDVTKTASTVTSEQEAVNATEGLELDIKSIEEALVENQTALDNQSTDLAVTLEKMEIKELIAFAAEKKIEIKKNSKKNEIISTILEAAKSLAGEAQQ